MEPIKTKTEHDKHGDYEAPDAPERENGAYWIRWNKDGVESWSIAAYSDGQWTFPGGAGEYSRVTVEADYVKRGSVLDIGPRIPEPEA